MAVYKGYSGEQLRLITKVSRLYHQRRLTQPEIAKRLDLSQAKVSRALRDAEELGIVRITVHVPEGFFSDLETEIEDRYGLNDVVIVEPAGEDPRYLFQALGDGAGGYLENVIPKSEIVGISSWSETLLYAVNAMRSITRSDTKKIVQVLGGVGVSTSQGIATRLTERLAQVSGAEAMFLLAPGICTDDKARRAMLNDESCKQVFSYFDRISLLLFGIGTLEPSRYLRDSGNRMTAEEKEELARLGAVGDACQRFIDQDGKPVRAAFDSRVIGISFEQMMRIPRRVGVAGGMNKFEAIRGVLRGGCVTALVTDLEVAKRLRDEP